jgi:hypothetical protein
MAISDMTAVIAPPTDGLEPDVDWKAFEHRFGQPLPHDHKDFIDCFGQGSFNDFLHPYQPITNDKYLGLAYRREIDLDALRTIQRDFP